MTKFYIGIIVSLSVILIILSTVSNNKLKSLREELEASIVSNSQLYETIKICQSQHNTCREELQVQNEAYKKLLIAYDKASIQHNTDEKENIDSYFDRQEAIQNKKELEGIEYLLQNFLGRP